MDNKRWLAKSSFSDSSCRLPCRKFTVNRQSRIRVSFLTSSPAELQIQPHNKINPAHITRKGPCRKAEPFPKHLTRRLSLLFACVAVRDTHAGAVIVTYHRQVAFINTAASARDVRKYARVPEVSVDRREFRVSSRCETPRRIHNPGQRWRRH